MGSTNLVPHCSPGRVELDLANSARRFGTSRWREILVGGPSAGLQKPSMHSTGDNDCMHNDCHLTGDRPPARNLRSPHGWIPRCRPLRERLHESFVCYPHRTASDALRSGAYRVFTRKRVCLVNSSETPPVPERTSICTRTAQKMRARPQELMAFILRSDPQAGAMKTSSCQEPHGASRLGFPDLMVNQCRLNTACVTVLRQLLLFASCMTARRLCVPTAKQQGRSVARLPPKEQSATSIGEAQGSGVRTAERPWPCSGRRDASDGVMLTLGTTSTSASQIVVGEFSFSRSTPDGSASFLRSFIQELRLHVSIR